MEKSMTKPQALKSGLEVTLISAKGKNILCEVTEVIATEEGGWRISIVNKTTLDLVFTLAYGE